MRGRRLRLRDQELRRYRQLMPIEVTVDEWTTDTDENRRLRAATRRLLLLSDLPPLVRRRLVRIDRQLADVQPLPIGRCCAHWTPTRLNARLHPLLRLADPRAERVNRRAPGRPNPGALFVLSMATLLKRFVTRLLRELAEGSLGPRSGQPAP